MISKNKNIAMFLFKVRLSWDTTIILLLIINTYIIKSIRYGYRGTSARCELALILECVQSVVGVIIQARACGKNQSSRKHPCYFFVVKKLGRKPDLRSSIVSTMFLLILRVIFMCCMLVFVMFVLIVVLQACMAGIVFAKLARPKSR